MFSLCYSSKDNSNWFHFTGGFPSYPELIPIMILFISTNIKLDEKNKDNLPLFFLCIYLFFNQRPTIHRLFHYYHQSTLCHFIHPYYYLKSVIDKHFFRLHTTFT